MSTSRYVTLELFAEMSGYSRKAIERKIEDGVFLEGREYRRAPDGRLLIDLQGFEKWVVNPPRAA